MTDKVIKFGKSKKAMARKTKEKKAAENRVRFGRTKAQKNLDKAVSDKKTRQLDQHKREE